MAVKIFLHYFIACILIVWSLGYGLDAMPMHIWDESRQANNALEMMISGNYLFTTYDGHPDFWNTKPHLLIILQAFSMKLLGPGLLALRLPSMLAGAITCLLWFRFFLARKQLFSAWFFLFILLSCGGFNTYHVVRTGDYDALLLLFVSAAVLQIGNLVFDNGGTKNAWGFGFMIALAALTKSIAGLLWFPVLAVAMVIVNKNCLVQCKKYAVPILLPLLLVPIYYVVHEMATPGYLHAVWENEFTERYLQPNEGHHTGLDFYWSNFRLDTLGWFFYPATIALVYWLIAKKEYKLNMKWIGVVLVLFLVIIHISATRISWYAAPAVLLFVVLLASFLSIIPDLLKIKNEPNRSISMLLIFALMLPVALYEWQLQMEKNFTLEGVKPEKVLLDAEKAGKFRYSGKWLCGDYKPYELYYSKVFKRKQVQFQPVSLLEINATDTVHFYDYRFSDSLNLKYHVTQLHAPDPNYPIWVFQLAKKEVTQRN